MFNAKSKPAFDANAASIIGAGTTINGDIETNGDIRVDGVLNGNILSANKVLVGPEGVVNGNINGAESDVLGKITGTIKVSGLLFLRSKANVKGDIYADKLQIEPSATFNGACHMGAAIVDMNAEKSQAINL